MQKKDLVNLIESVVFEGVMDELTTRVSRAVVNWIKSSKHLNKIPYFETKAGTITIVVEFNQVSSGVLTSHRGNYNSGYKEATVFVNVPKDFTDNQLNDFIPEFKSMLRHELEHARQHQRNADPTKGTHLQVTPDSTVIRSSSEVYRNLEKSRAYFLSPHEVEAFVMGLYKKAKTQRVSLKDLISQYASQIGYALKKNGVDAKEAMEFAREISQKWQEYAKKRVGMKDLLGSLDL